jgi:hypothetical protein
MKSNVALIFVASILMAGIAEAQVRTITRTGPNGKTVVLKIDGKYLTCLVNSQSLGYSLASATRCCDMLRNQKRVK